VFSFSTEGSKRFLSNLVGEEILSLNDLDSEIRFKLALVVLSLVVRS